MILNQAQAEAVYSAMCALNNVGHSYLRTNFTDLHGKRISVKESDEGVAIAQFAFQGNPAEQTEVCELYESPSAFAAAYGLQ